MSMKNIIYLALVLLLELMPNIGSIAFQTEKNVLSESKDPTIRQAQIDETVQGILNRGTLDTNAILSETQSDLDQEDQLGHTNTEVEDNSPNIVDIRKEIPALLAQFCPMTEACVDDKSHNSSKHEYTPDKDTCCTTCSCSDNCQTTGDCCFPSPDNSHDNTNCYITITPTLSLADIMGFKSYLMVDSVPGDNINSGSGSGPECGDAIVAPWGSLFPVYSKSRQQIYKNHVCAKVDGVDDGIQFEAYAICRDSAMLAWSDFFDSSNWEHFKSKCSIWFQEPAEARAENSTLRRHLCYNNLVDTCKEQFNNYTGLSRDKIQAACASGLWSPYRSFRAATYKNVFCAMCNNDYNTDNCPTGIFLGTGIGDFIVLLQSSTNIDADTNTEISTENVQQACFVQNGEMFEDTCRPVMCPVGQIYSIDGVCEFKAKIWYNVKVMTSLQLTTDVLIDGTNLRKYHFSSQWIEDRWNLDTLHFVPANESDPMIAENVIVHLWKNFASVNPRNILVNISTLALTNWTVATTDGEVLLTSEFMDNRDRSYYSWTTHQTRNGNYVYEENGEKFQIDIWNFLFVDRMAFCDHVHLKSSEGEFGVRGNRLYIRLTGSYVDAFYYPDDNDNSVVSVCIEDSGLTSKSEFESHYLNQGSADVTSSVLILIASVSLLFSITSFTLDI